jgi:MerR family transcriptional regulator, light-induced transcriptional regulator
MPSVETREPQYPMRVVARRTGLNPSLLRAWERRYTAVSPGRSEGGQRLYSEEDIRRLALLREAVELGHNISQVADLSAEALTALVRRAADPSLPAGLPAATRPPTGAVSPPRPSTAGLGTEAAFLERALNAVKSMDTKGLESVLNRGSMALGPAALVDGVLLPLLSQIGVLWRQGEMSPAAEHMATGVLRRFLDWLLEALGTHEPGPLMIVGTPAGHHHEFGAMLAAVVSAAEGWHILSVGTDLPADEIAAVARAKGASAIALSALHPSDDPQLLPEMARLRGAVTGDVRILLGGPAALSVRTELEALGVEVLSDLNALRQRVRIQPI